MKNLLSIALLLLFSGFILTSCGDDDPDEMPGTMTIVDIASADAQFSTLVAALQKANLVETLQGDGPFTVFAPTNAAFSALLADLGVSSLDDLSADALTPILLYHVLGAKVESTALSNSYVTTASTGPDDNQLILGIDITNGVTLNGDTKVTTADVQADNGVIHIVDKVLLPPTVVDIALDNPDFSILVQALTRANLVTTASGDGPFTIFAPTNAAFADLLVDLGVSSLDMIDDATLTSVLLYHVVSGNVQSSQLSNGDVATLNGANLTVSVDDGVSINETSDVILADLQGTNGVVHVINKVLVP